MWVTVRMGTEGLSWGRRIRLRLSVLAGRAAGSSVARRKQCGRLTVRLGPDAYPPELRADQDRMLGRSAEALPQSRGTRGTAPAAAPGPAASDRLRTPAENVATVWISAGSGPTTSIPGTTISSLICCTARSASPLTSRSAVKPDGTTRLLPPRLFPAGPASRRSRFRWRRSSSRRRNAPPSASP